MPQNAPPGSTPGDRGIACLPGREAERSGSGPGGIALLVEPINTLSIPGYFLNGSRQAELEFLLRPIDRIGYSGRIGCEYNPVGDTVEGLAWAKPYL